MKLLVGGKWRMRGVNWWVNRVYFDIGVKSGME